MERIDNTIIEVNVPGAPSDLVANVTQELIGELNTQVGPVASRISEKVPAGSRGEVISFGQIALALISAGVTKQIAQILIQYIKRNPRYVIQVGAVKITKDYASKDDVAAINSLVRELNIKTDKPA